MTTDNAKPMPCPFCGSMPMVFERTCDKSTPYDPSHRAFPKVQCGCGASIWGDDWSDAQTAISRWNARMADKTGISWADSTFNPWIGCTKISPACDNCYAERDWQDRRHAVTWGAGQPRKRTSIANWKLPLRWNAKPFYECEHCGWRGEDDTQSSRICMNCGTGTRLTRARRRVFCASLADWLDNEVPIEWLVDLLDLIRRTPNLDWLLLTKRIGNWRTRLVAVHNSVADMMGEEDTETDALFDFIDLWRSGSVPVHAWLGASVCNQAEADRDIPKLLAVPAAVRFLSIEPMLGPVQLNLRQVTHHARTCSYVVSYGPAPCTCSAAHGGIDWVIAGGESGPKARPMHPEWVRSLRDQCAEAGVPFLFKQWGEWVPRSAYYHTFSDGRSCADIDPSAKKWPCILLTEKGLNGRDLRNAVGAGNEAYMQRVGVKAAGRLLDGREHNAFQGAHPAEQKEVE